MRGPAAMDHGPAVIDRGFVRLPAGLVHYRSAGASIPGGPLPLLLAHSGPGSSAGLVPMLTELGRARHVVAPDMLGNGDSDPPNIDTPDIGWYADRTVEVLDLLGLGRIDCYGDHTGAHIACELALRHPGRVRRLVLDGIGLYPPDLQAELLQRYAPPVVPDEHGGHLAWAWHMVRELWLHFPHYARDPAHRLHHQAVPPAAVRQRLVVDLLKALPTYHLAYRAAFNHPVAQRLPLLGLPTLVMAVHGDPLGPYLDEAAALVRGAEHDRVPREQRAARVQAFVDAP